VYRRKSEAPLETVSGTGRAISRSSRIQSLKTLTQPIPDGRMPRLRVHGTWNITHITHSRFGNRT